MNELIEKADTVTLWEALAALAEEMKNESPLVRKFALMIVKEIDRRLNKDFEEGCI